MLNKKFHNKVMEIKNTKDTWEDMAQECNININKFQRAIINNENLTEQELFNIYKYSYYKGSYVCSYNELLRMFNYQAKSNIVVKGEIYWVKFEGEGSVQNGLRPAIIISNKENNYNSPTVQVASITTASKPKLPVHVAITGCGLTSDSTITVEQTQTINKNELGQYIGFATRDIIQKLNKAISIQFDTKSISNDENSSILLSFIDYVTNNLNTKDPDKLKKALMTQFNVFVGV